MKLKALAVLFTLLPLALKLGCALWPGNPENARELLGNWGGEHIALVITTKGATVEYDCGRGTIDEPLRIDDAGKFEVAGRHIHEHGGPVQENELPDQHPAQYHGQVEGGKMILTVKLSDSETGLGTFELKLGSPSRLFKCL